MRIRTAVLAALLPLAFLLGCGGSGDEYAPGPHPALEARHEDEVVEEFCDYGRAEADAHGANAAETYALECE